MPAEPRPAEAPVPAAAPQPVAAESWHWNCPEPAGLRHVVSGGDWALFEIRGSAATE